MTAAIHDPTLDGIRREIDAIDGQILGLIGQRLAASARVRQAKNRMSQAMSPIRPAREAAILRRLLAERPPDMDPELLVRLWRVILTSSTLAQAPVSVHLTESSARDPDLRAMVADHFCAMPVVSHASAGEIVCHLASHPGDIGVVRPEESWIEGLDNGLRIMGRLPALTGEAKPFLFVIGRCEAQASGDDETVLVGCAGKTFDRELEVLWQTESAGLPVFGVRGFLNAVSNSSFIIAGRYPRPLEV